MSYTNGSCWRNFPPAKYHTVSFELGEHVDSAQMCIVKMNRQSNPFPLSRQNGKKIVYRMSNISNWSQLFVRILENAFPHIYIFLDT